MGSNWSLGYTGLRHNYWKAAGRLTLRVARRPIKEVTDEEFQVE